MAEQWSPKPQVAGSIPVAPATATLIRSLGIVAWQIDSSRPAGKRLKPLFEGDKPEFPYLEDICFQRDDSEELWKGL